jgi:hypothetical protein
MQPSKRLLAIRGLNANHNHDVKNGFKSAATSAGAGKEVWSEFHEN